MEASILKIIESSEYCLLPKLAKGLDESEDHPEFNSRDCRLSQYFPTLLKSLGEADLTQDLKLSSSALSSLLILHKELQCRGPWNTEKSKEYSKKLDDSFQLLYEISLNNLLEATQPFYSQAIFDDLLDKLCLKLTSDNFKKYPSLIEVYCTTMGEIMNCNVKLNPATVFPIALLLTDDYEISNKLKGVKCCRSILESLSPEDFQEGNYYEIIYGSLKKAFLNRDLGVTKCVCECLPYLLKLLPSHVCHSKADQLYSESLDQLSTEANLYRKSTLFIFTTKLIQILKVECVKRKKIATVIHDNFDACCTDGVADILLPQVLGCYEEWIKYCWCTWKLNKDQKLLHVLFKVLYTCHDCKVNDKVLQLIITLISLCTEGERIQIVNSLDSSSQIKCEEFSQKATLITKHFA